MSEKMRSAPARPITTKLICWETWPMEPEKRFVRLRNGTTMSMESATPAMEGLGVPAASMAQPASATTTYERLPMFMRMGPSVLP